MSELKYNEPAERFTPTVEKSLYANATAVMVSSEDGCWVHYAKYCERIANIKSEADKVIAEQRADAFKRERHQKYKRCLAMANYCYTNVHCIMGHRLCALADWKKEWFERWSKRWMELAEKLKDKEV